VSLLKRFYDYAYLISIACVGGIVYSVDREKLVFCDVVKPQRSNFITEECLAFVVLGVSEFKALCVMWSVCTLGDKPSLASK